MATEKMRIFTYISPEANKKVEAFMKISGLSKAKACSIAIQYGIEAISITFDKDWTQYFESRLKAEIEKIE